MKKTNDHPSAGYKLSQINLKSRQIMENKQEPKISTGLAVRTKLVAGDDGEPPAIYSGEIPKKLTIQDIINQSRDNVLANSKDRYVCKDC